MPYLEFELGTCIVNVTHVVVEYLIIQVYNYI